MEDYRIGRTAVIPRAKNFQGKTKKAVPVCLLLLRLISGEPKDAPCHRNVALQQNPRP